MRKGDDADQQRKKDLHLIAQRYHYAQTQFRSKPCLVALSPNDDGWLSVIPYDGGPYDATKYRVEDGGWDHQHCLLCRLRINVGDIWRAATTSGEVGLCDVCHNRLLSDQTALGS